MIRLPLPPVVVGFQFDELVFDLSEQGCWFRGVIEWELSID